MPQGTGNTTIGSGIGVFDQASGGGTFEVFARDYYYYDSNTNINYQAYQQVLVNHLQITLPNGPEQTDTRYVGVSVRVGMNDRTNETGVNIGGPTTDDAPLSNPRLTQVRSEYEYGGPGPHDGLSFARNLAGDGLDWAYQFPSGSSIPSLDGGSYFFESHGTAQVLKGYGFYHGYTGSSEWEAYEGWMFDVTPQRGTYSNVVIDRYTLSAPVPEPETYALMFVGLAVLGLSARRRRTRF
ncbi:MAG: PEP-CTERM sorting domain-containing protein [Burkholderiales bacterium]|nr:PEP-CTERM sorting domain-containing protein [Burkholderiales bacterium]